MVRTLGGKRKTTRRKTTRRQTRRVRKQRRMRGGERFVAKFYYANGNAVDTDDVSGQELQSLQDVLTNLYKGDVEVDGDGFVITDAEKPVPLNKKTDVKPKQYGKEAWPAGMYVLVRSE